MKGFADAYTISPTCRGALSGSKISEKSLIPQAPFYTNPPPPSPETLPWTLRLKASTSPNQLMITSFGRGEMVLA